MEVRSGLLLGFIVALSSTAIVLRGLSTRGELETPHGRLALGILVFQDLCVVPMVLVIPVLGGTAADVSGIWIPLLKSAGVVVGVLAAAWLIVPRFLDAVARTRQRDLFILSVFLVCLGTAWAVLSVGVSLALGGFLGGLVISSSRYREQAIADLVPLRDVLASVFFVAIGMLLDFRDALDHLVPILGLFGAIVVGKFVIVVLLSSAVMRLPLRVGVLTATSLSQVGEFSFVLLLAAGNTGLLEEAFQDNLTVAIILSMLATPFALALGPHLARGFGRLNPLVRVLRVRTTAEPREPEPLRGHVIIAGYGLTGRKLASSLKRIGVEHIVVDLNSENVRDAVRCGEPACFGDVTSAEVLGHLGVAEAAQLVIAINDPDATARAISGARRAAPELQITARTTYEDDVAKLEAVGATQVVAAERAAADAVVDCVLRALNHEADGKIESDDRSPSAPEA